MANQSYMDRDSGAAPSIADPTKTKGSRAVEQGFSGGKNPTAGPNKTPAPLRAPPATPDLARSQSMGRESYGANAYGGASSIEPGTTVTQTGIDIRPPDGDAALDLVKKHGTVLGGKDPAESWQDRDESQQGYPAAHGMRNRQANDGSPGGQIPATVGATSEQPVRKPS